MCAKNITDRTATEAGHATHISLCVPIVYHPSFFNQHTRSKSPTLPSLPIVHLLCYMIAYKIHTHVREILSILLLHCLLNNGSLLFY